MRASLSLAWVVRRAAGIHFRTRLIYRGWNHQNQISVGHTSNPLRKANTTSEIPFYKPLDSSPQNAYFFFRAGSEWPLFQRRCAQEARPETRTMTRAGTAVMAASPDVLDQLSSMREGLERKQEEPGQGVWQDLVE